MIGEIITIGDELISGRILDLNAKYAAGRLTASGLGVTRITSVGDDPITVTQTLEKALESSHFVIVTGGLGPTDDDTTNEIVSAALNRSLLLNSDLLKKVKVYLDARGLEMTPSIEKMAWLPKGARILDPDGPACGCCIIEQDVYLYFLPGVPDQMKHLLDRFVIPEILSLCSHIPVADHRVLKFYGLNETDIAETLKELQGKTGRVVMGFYPNFPENHITLSLSGDDRTAISEELEQVEHQIRRIIGSYIFTSEDENMEDRVGRALLEKGVTLSVAESCSGGLIGHRLTNVPGSSAYFKGGIVVYSNQSKCDFLHVTPDTLQTHGAVSDPVVREMVQAVRGRFKTDLGLAVTGIAGPEGGSREKPVGTAYLGLSTKDNIFSDQYRFWGDRSQVKLEASTMALDWVRRFLNGHPFLPGV